MSNLDNNKRIEVSIVIPCLNEAETIGICVRKARDTIERHRLAGEIIVADNGSLDGSLEIAAESGARVITVSEKGYGAALMGGIAVSKGEFIVMGDADDSYDFTNFILFIEKLREGFDLVMGCRFPRCGGTIMPGAMPWKHRWIGNPVLTFIGRLFFNAKISDFHCGLRAFRLDSYKKMDLHTTGMEFASEMVVKASLKGMRITEVPITLYKDGRSGKPHLRSWRDGWRHLRFMLLYSPRWLFLYPGIFLSLFGAIAGGILVAKPVIIQGIGFDTNTLLVCAMSLLAGYQLIMFSVFAKIFSISEGLLPQRLYMDKLLSVIKLEHGLLVGMLLCLIGVGLIFYAFWYWKLSSFGSISYPFSLRITVPGVTIFTLGIQTIIFSFFLSILGLKRK